MTTREKLASNNCATPAGVVNRCDEQGVPSAHRAARVAGRAHPGQRAKQVLQANKPPCNAFRLLQVRRMLSPARCRLKALSDEELLSLFKDVVKAKAPAMLESETSPAAGVLSRLAPFATQQSAPEKQQPAPSPSSPVVEEAFPTNPGT